MKIFLFLLLHGNLICYAQDEFCGPFPSWADAKKRFGAKGNGKNDDTKSLQRALDSFTVTLTQFNTKNKPYVVLYLPAGVYNISETLVLKGKIGVSIIGEDPVNTIIRWTGRNDDTMFWANGSAYFKIARLTWDAGNKKNMECLGIHWAEKWSDQFSRSYATLNIELSDMIFKGNPVVGIHGGTLGGGGIHGTGSNDSEITIKRCSFYDCSNAGIRIAGYNALDYWIWDCKFSDCYIGVWNVLGSFHAYRCLFKRSKSSDFHHKGGYYTSVRECYSVGSRAFSMDEGGSCNPFKRVFQGNTIINTDEMPIEYYHLGSITLMDNIISSSKSSEYPFLVNTKNWCTSELRMLSIGNTYGYKEPLRIANEKRRFIRVADKIVKIPSADGSLFEKNMPRTPAKATGKVFEIPRNASTAIIQKIINDAASIKGSKPIIHFPLGRYFIDKSLTIPPGADMQIVGDGLIYASEILPVNLPAFSNKFMLEINGPTFISIRDIQIGVGGGDPNNGNAILFKNIDQKGATCIMDQIYSISDTALVADGLNYLYIEKNNSFFSSGNYLSGGKLQKEGKGTFTVNFFGGQFAYPTILNNAKFLAKDCWWEGSVRQPIRLIGDGDITIDGAMIAPSPVDSQATIVIQNFRGRVSLLNMYIQGGIDIAPNNTNLKVFGWNLHFYYKLNVYDFISPRSNYQAMFSGISVQNFNQSNPIGTNPYPIKEMKFNIPDENTFVSEMLSQTRSNRPLKKSLASGSSSSVKISRVTLGYLKKGITIVN